MLVQTIVIRWLSIFAYRYSTSESPGSSQGNRRNWSSRTAGAGHEADRRLAGVTSISSSGPSTSPEPPCRLSTAMAAAASASPADVIGSHKAGTRNEEVGPTQGGGKESSGTRGSARTRAVSAVPNR